MPRQPRVEGADLIHHVTGHSHQWRDAFPDDRSRRGFLALLATTALNSSWHVLAYCLLTTHYHLLVHTDAPNLGDGMRRVHGRHAQLANARGGTAGTLWRDRFHSTVVRSNTHVIRAAVYIDANPVAAGLCTHPADWVWSSYRAVVGMAEPWAWHRPDILLSHLAAKPHEAPSLYRDLVDVAVVRIRTQRAS